MKKGKIYRGTIEKVEYMDRGFIRSFEDAETGEQEEGTVLVKNGMPGQKVEFQIRKKRQDRAEGRILKVIEKSPLETREKACDIFPECGGCMYQTMSYASQLEMKERQIRDLLEPFMEEDTVWGGIHGSPQEFEYRNKMEFSFGDSVKDGPLELGLHRRGTAYDVLSAGSCRLVHRDMTKILETVLSFYRERRAPYYRKTAHTGYLRHLLLRRSVTTGDLLVHIVTTSQGSYDEEILAQELLKLGLEGRIAGILHIINDSLSDTVQSDETRILWGTDHFYETVLGLRFKVSTFSFFQPNTLASEILYSVVRDYIGDVRDQTVFDLYSGTGTIAQLAAAVADRVIGIEIVPEAVEAAAWNAQMNGITNCRFIAGDVLKELDTIEERPDTIILDPPRDGVHPKALPKILSYGVDRIIYISCKATSLVRDLPYFRAAGYRVKKACCIDQFAQGPHIEAVSLLQRMSNTRPKAITLDVEMEDYYRIKGDRTND